MDDVADRAGVSRALVSLVMRDSPRVSDASRQKVQAAAAELGYRPNVLARNLARGQTSMIGVMLNDLHNPYFTEVAEGLAEAAQDAGLQVLVNSGWQRAEGETTAIEALLELRIDGMVLGGPRIPLEVLTDYATQVPTAVVSYYGEPAAFDTVSNDEEHGAALIVDHLVELGHERIAHINAAKAAGGPERCSGFITAMTGYGLAPIVVDGDFNEAAGFEATAQLMSLRQPPTAIFACNDLAATGVLSYLQNEGIRVPQDVSLVGYDDTLLARIGPVSLTTVNQPRLQIGQRALELLTQRIAGRTEPMHQLIQPTLVVRSTTAGPGNTTGTRA